MSDIALKFKLVSKSYGAGQVLKNFNLSVPRGRIVTLIGPSGCGKTTILKLINRLVEPEAGHILLEGTDIGSLDPPAGWTFSQYDIASVKVNDE